MQKLIPSLQWPLLWVSGGTAGTAFPRDVGPLAPINPAHFSAPRCFHLTMPPRDLSISAFRFARFHLLHSIPCRTTPPLISPVSRWWARGLFWIFCFYKRKKSSEYSYPHNILCKCKLSILRTEIPRTRIASKAICILHFDGYYKIAFHPGLNICSQVEPHSSVLSKNVYIYHKMSQRWNIKVTLKTLKTKHLFLRVGPLGALLYSLFPLTFSIS